MNENFKYFSKLTASATFTFLKLNLLSSFSTVLVFIIELIMLSQNVNVGASGHVSAIPFVTMVFAQRPIGASLCVLSIVASPFILFNLSNKYIINKIVHQVVEDKSETLLGPILDKILNKIQIKQPDLMINTGNFTMEKLKLIHALKTEKSESKWMRRILIFGLKKIDINDIDFSEENQNFFKII